MHRARKYDGVVYQRAGTEIWWIRYYVDGRDTGKRQAGKEEVTHLLRLGKGGG